MQPNCLASTFGSPISRFLHFKLLIYKVKLNSENAMLVCSSLPFNLFTLVGQEYLVNAHFKPLGHLTPPVCFLPCIQNYIHEI